MILVAAEAVVANDAVVELSACKAWDEETIPVTSLPNPLNSPINDPVYEPVVLGAETFDA